MVGKLGPHSPSNAVLPSWGAELDLPLAQLRAGLGPQASSARSRPHKAGPQEFESTPWVHPAGHPRARSINSQAHKRGVSAPTGPSGKQLDQTCSSCQVRYFENKLINLGVNSTPSFFQKKPLGINSTRRGHFGRRN